MRRGKKEKNNIKNTVNNTVITAWCQVETANMVVRYMII